ncbi:MAG: hypothetical protein KI786_10415, partial [Mameliella sp.]|nr:hypothetical protein [Phaeodactylibacter sp.]
MTDQLNKAALAELFYREIEKVARNTAMMPEDQVAAYYRLLTLLFVECTKAERIQFSTLFARMAYVCHRENVDKRLQFYLHQFRKLALKNLRQPAESPTQLLELG